MPDILQWGKISEAKELLFLSAKETATRIRGEGKTRAELKDIVDIFRRFDEKDSSLPTFVADCYKSMPPSSGYEVLADHMVTFLSEIAQLREEVRQLKISRNDNESTIDIKRKSFVILKMR